MVIKDKETAALLERARQASRTVAIHPAAFMAGDVFGIAVALDGAKEPVLVLSTRMLRPLSKMDEMGWRLDRVDHDLLDLQSRWSFKSIRRFLRGRDTPTPREAFNEWRACFAGRIVFVDERIYDLLALLALSTYLLPLWATSPIVHFSGGGHSGKSITQEMLSLLGFNGLYIQNPTEAAFADDLDKLRATVCLDEAEGFERPTPATNAIRSMMNAAYVQGAPLRRKKDPKTGLSVSRYNYGSIFLSSIRGLEDVIADRTIMIPTKAAPYDPRANLPRPLDENRNDPKKYRRLRNMAYSMALTSWQRFCDAKKRVQSPLDKGGNPLMVARQWELWQPTTVMAGICGGNELVKSIAELYRDLRRHYRMQAGGTRLGSLVAQLVQYTNKGFAPTKGLCEALDVKEPELRKLMRPLHVYGIVHDKKRIGARVGPLPFGKQRQVRGYEVPSQALDAIRRDYDLESV